MINKSQLKKKKKCRWSKRITLKFLTKWKTYLGLHHRLEKECERGDFIKRFQTIGPRILGDCQTYSREYVKFTLAQVPSPTVDPQNHKRATIHQLQASFETKIYSEYHLPASIVGASRSFWLSQKSTKEIEKLVQRERKKIQNKLLKNFFSHSPQYKSNPCFQFPHKAVCSSLTACQ